MPSTIGYATAIIDLTDAMLAHRRSLNAMQIEQLQMINRRSVGFVTDFLQHEKGSLDGLVSYLNHDAMTPLTVVIGAGEVLVMGMCEPLPPAFHEAVAEILEYAYALREELLMMLDDLLHFMKRVGYERQRRSH